MSDTKDLLAQASAALDAERSASISTIDSLTAANVAMQAQLDTANATIAGLMARLDPWAAVDKTGATDVTDQVQALIDRGLAIPAGTYLIDAAKGLHATSALKMGAQTILKAKPNNAERYCMVSLAPGVTIDGGQIIGDRDGHTLSSPTSTDEHGYGLRLATGCKASNVQVSKCTGDGAVVVGDNVEIRNLSSRFNRRQGMSVFASKGLRVYDSQFTDTSGAPNGPCAGVDIEPDSGSVTDAVFTRCAFNGNRVGFEAWMRSGIAGGITGVQLVNCTFDNNSNHVWTKDEDGSGPVSATITGCTFGKLSGSGNAIKADAGSSLSVSGNTFAILAKYAIAQLNGGTVTQSSNTYL